MFDNVCAVPCEYIEERGRGDGRKHGRNGNKQQAEIGAGENGMR